ncbi:MAG: malectin domain-containing carbohydrate-binding protein [Granulosicoccus sp.]
MENNTPRSNRPFTHVAFAALTATVLGLGGAASAIAQELVDEDNGSQDKLTANDILAHDWHTGTWKKFVSNANPITTEHPGGDPDYLVDGDTIYVYTSTDANQQIYRTLPDSDNDGFLDNTYLDMDGYTVWSSQDMVHWTNHGVQFAAVHLDTEKWKAAHASTIVGVPDIKDSYLELDVAPRAMWAPTVAKYSDDSGTTYVLYYPKGIDGVGKFTTGYATSSKPTGPFIDQGPIYGDFEGEDGIVRRYVMGMDPNVFQDGDTTYIYGNGAADELDPAGNAVVATLTGIDHGSKVQRLASIPKPIDYDMNNTLRSSLAGNAPLRKDFHEGGSMHKSNGKYYFSWAEHEHAHYNGWYSMCETPMGPCEWMGPTIKGIYQGNQHGSFATFKGQEYYITHINYDPNDIRDRWGDSDGVGGGWQSYRRTWTFHPVTYNADKSIRVMYPEGGFAGAPNINIGGKYTDSNGLVYVDSKYVSDGGYGSVDAEGLKKLEAANPGVDDLELYRGHRFVGPGGTISVNVPGLENGVYQVALKFAEIFPNAVIGTTQNWFSRVMNISVQGVPVVADLDVLAVAGHYGVHEELLSATVTNGTLDIEISASAGEAMLSAVEITAPTKPGWAVNIGGSSTNVGSVSYEADPGVGDFDDGTQSAITLDPSIATGANADEQELFQTSRVGWGGLNYSNPALANGNYQVTLGFVETYHSKDDKRLFDVAIQGTQVLDDFDIHHEAGGKNIALKRVFPAKVTDGSLNIDLTTEKDASKISFIKVERLADDLVDSSIRINVGDSSKDVDTGGAVFLSDRYLSAGAGPAQVGYTTSSITRIDDTFQGNQQVTPSDEEIYKSERVGKELGYAIPVRNGRYSVRLMFAELQYSADGKREFDVFLEGGGIDETPEKVDELYSMIDIHRFARGESAIGKNKAVDFTFDTDVKDQELNIVLKADVGNVSLSGIVVTPRYLRADENGNPLDPTKWDVANYRDDAL